MSLHCLRAAPDGGTLVVVYFRGAARSVTPPTANPSIPPPPHLSAKGRRKSCSLGSLPSSKTNGSWKRKCATSRTALEPWLRNCWRRANSSRSTSNTPAVVSVHPVKCWNAYLSFPRWNYGPHYPWFFTYHLNYNRSWYLIRNHLLKSCD